MMQFVPSQWDNISFQQLQKYAHSQVCYFKRTQSSNSIKLNILRFSASAHIFFQSRRSAPEEVDQVRTEWKNPRFQHLNRKQVSQPRAEHFDLQTQNLAEKVHWKHVCGMRGCRFVKSWFDSGFTWFALGSGLKSSTVMNTEQKEIKAISCT